MSYHFALERPPHHGAVAHGKFGEAAPGKNAALGDIKRIHDGDNVVVARAGSLDVLDQLRRDELVHVPPKVRRVQRDAPLEVVEKEHGGEWSALCAGLRAMLEEKSK